MKKGTGFLSVLLCAAMLCSLTAPGMAESYT